MSVCMERTMHRSSAQLPTLEKISLISAPLLPNLLKANGEGKAAPVRRSVLSVIGIGFPAYFASAGLGSNVSTWDAPPFINRCTIRLAFAGNGGFFGASGPAASPAGAAANWPVLPSSEVSATAPMPIPQRVSISRLLRIRSRSFIDTPLIHEGEFIGFEQHVSVARPNSRCLCSGPGEVALR